MRMPLHKQTIEEFESELKNKELVLWGKTSVCEELCDRYQVKYIVDKNDELCDQKINKTIRIVQPEELYLENNNEIVVLVTTRENTYIEISGFLQNLGIEEIFYFSTMKDAFLSNFSESLYDNLDDIRNVGKLLADSYSKKVFMEVVNRRICGCVSGYSDLKTNDTVQYIFWPAIMSKNEGAIIDCGGYIGDSIDRFINSLGMDNIDRIYSFEGLPENVDILNEMAKTNNKIVVIPKLVTEKKDKLVFNVTEKRGACFISNIKTSTRFAKNEPLNKLVVDAVSIDEEIPSNEAVRYIKMDIEGAEYSAIKGAEKTIKREKPGLAISIYHNPDDYYRLANLIKEYVPEYKLFIRHHKEKYFDTVLYAFV